nr:hypothetical protein BaRGS_010169 [Batillaria attramentaria]
MKQELETRTGLRLVLPDLKHDVLSVKESPFLAELALCRNTLVVLDGYDRHDEVHENLLQQTVKEAEHPDGRTVFIQRGSLCPDWVINRLETSTLMIHPHDAGHQLDRNRDFWATVAAFLGKPDGNIYSRGDVEEDSQVDIHTAVCTDVDRVRQVVKLSEDECVSSPVAEYWAGHEFRFKKPVTITLPHFLPPDPDPSLEIEDLRFSEGKETTKNWTDHIISPAEAGYIR